MGSSNGTTRGQLRPYLSGRTPPFLLVGLLVILGILGFSYWSLNTQYNDLQTEIQKLQERLRVYAEKRESVEKMNSALQAQLETHKEENRKFKITVDKRDQEVITVGEQLRNREEELNRANSQLSNQKLELEKYESRDKQKDLEISSLQDQTKTLKIENQELADAKAQLAEQLETLKTALANHNQNQGLFEQNAHAPVAPGLLEEKSKEEQGLNPDVGIPPQNKDLNQPQPVLPMKPLPPDENNNVNKIQTPAPESPDISNLEKLQDFTSKVQPNEMSNNVNEVDPPVAQNGSGNV